MSDKYENIQVEFADAIARITINRPQALNALNKLTIKELTSAVDTVRTRNDVRVVILCGAGDRAFVAGADIVEMREMNVEQAYDFSRLGQLLTQKIEDLPQVVIARVQGFALGGGCELAMAADMIVAGESAKFGQPEVNLGLLPGFGGTQRLARRVGMGTCLEILCAGRTLTAAEASAMGLVSRVVADTELDSEIAKMIKRILKAAPHAITLTKKLARQSFEMSLHTGLNAEAIAFSQLFSHSDTREGLSAFVEKRSASFSR